MSPACPHGVPYGVACQDCIRQWAHELREERTRAATIAECVAVLRDPSIVREAAEAHENYDPVFGRVTGDHWVRPSDIDRSRTEAAFTVVVEALEKMAKKGTT